MIAKIFESEKYGQIVAHLTDHPTSGKVMSVSCNLGAIDGVGEEFWVCQGLMGGGDSAEEAVEIAEHLLEGATLERVELVVERMISDLPNEDWPSKA